MDMHSLTKDGQTSQSAGFTYILPTPMLARPGGLNQSWLAYYPCLSLVVFQVTIEAAIFSNKILAKIAKSEFLCGN